MKRKIEIKLGGEDFTLVPNFEALEILEQRTGASLLAACGELARGQPRLSLIVSVIYAGVSAGGDTKWSFSKLGNFMLENRFYRESSVHSAAIDFIGELMQAGSDSPEQKKTAEEPPSQSTTSSSPPKPTE